MRFFSAVLLVLVLFSSAGAQDLKKDLVFACFEGDAGRVVNLIKQIEDIDFLCHVPSKSDGCLLENGDSWTALTAAIAGKQWATAGYLIGRGCNVNLTTKHGYHPSWFLAWKCDQSGSAYEFARLLFALEASMDVAPTFTIDTLSQNTAAHIAVDRRDKKMLQVMLDNGLDVNSESAGSISLHDYFAQSYALVPALKKSLELKPSDTKIESEIESLKSMARLFSQRNK